MESTPKETERFLEPASRYQRGSWLLVWEGQGPANPPNLGSVVCIPARPDSPPQRCLRRHLQLCLDGGLGPGNMTQILVPHADRPMHRTPNLRAKT